MIQITKDKTIEEKAQAIEQELKDAIEKNELTPKDFPRFIKDIYAETAECQRLVDIEVAAQVLADAFPKLSYCEIEAFKNAMRYATYLVCTVTKHM